MKRMAMLKAEVRNGRLVMDVPTELPEGTVLELVEADPFAQMDPDERQRLHAILDQSLQDAEAGRGVPAEEFFARVRR